MINEHNFDREKFAIEKFRLDFVRGKFHDLFQSTGKCASHQFCRVWLSRMQNKKIKKERKKRKLLLSNFNFTK